ncbi:hypothetical protein [Paenibacillus sp. GYB003]|uniref:hypothetical protein n=1 Tax=Paenibacillus sp. GYB003 TaxID=2994392 RepID=UPI002F96BEF9
MEAIVVIVVVAIAVLAVAASASGRKKRAAGMSGGGQSSGRKVPAPGQAPRPYGTDGLPTGLGLAPGIPLEETAGQLELAFEENFGPQLKRRVLGNHPRMSEAEYECKLLELKRYMLMNAVLKQVPMFSPEVDVIWHEMLMFTREYERFCRHWNGRTVHHAPHGEPVEMAGERAWFDWVYSALYTPTPYSGRIWRGFFRYPLDKRLVGTLGGDSEEAIVAALFNAKAAEYNPEVERTIALLIGKAKEQIAQAGAAGESPDRLRAHMERLRSSRPASADAMSGATAFGMLATSMMLFSVVDPFGYERHMEEVMPEEERKNQSACGSSGCSASYAGDGGADDRSDGGSDGGAGGSDSGSGGSSSCSSSSCSSGCGGGGGD